MPEAQTETESETKTATRKPSLWRHRDFLLFWSGQTVDQFGSQVSWLAIPLVAIVTLHATKFEVAALTAAGTLPVLLVSLPAGAVVDRTRRRPLMIACAAGCAAAMASIPAASAFGHVTLALVVFLSPIRGMREVPVHHAYAAAV